MDPGYRPSLEVTDILDDSEAITAVPLDEVLPLSSSRDTDSTTTPSNTITTPTAAVSSPLLSTTALALTDSKR